jgi:hypothetical protein
MTNFYALGYQIGEAIAFGEPFLPIDFKATKKRKSCNKGYPCKGSCISARYNCKNTLDGQSKSFGDYIKKNLGTLTKAQKSAAKDLGISTKTGKQSRLSAKEKAGIQKAVADDKSIKNKGTENAQKLEIKRREKSGKKNLGSQSVGALPPGRYMSIDVKDIKGVDAAPITKEVRDAAKISGSSIKANVLPVVERRWDAGSGSFTYTAVAGKDVLGFAKAVKSINPKAEMVEAHVVDPPKKGEKRAEVPTIPAQKITRMSDDTQYQAIDISAVRGIEASSPSKASKLAAANPTEGGNTLVTNIMPVVRVGWNKDGTPSYEVVSGGEGLAFAKAAKGENNKIQMVAAYVVK